MRKAQKASKPELEIEFEMPLTAMQEGILFRVLSGDSKKMYLMRATRTLNTKVERAVLERAWRILVGRHATLRTGFQWADRSRPVQVVYRDVPVEIQWLDWRSLGAKAQNARFEKLIDAQRNKGFDLTAAPLMRILVARTGAARYEMIWFFHHLIMDATSVHLVLGEFETIFNELCRGREVHLKPPVGYQVFQSWQAERDFSESIAFWQDELQGQKAASVLPMANLEKSLGKSVSRASAFAKINEGEFDRVLKFAQATGLSVNRLVQGAWALLMNRYTGEDDVVFGMMVSGRRNKEEDDFSGVVGLCINTLPVRLSVDTKAQLVSWLKAFDSKWEMTRKHQSYPFPLIKKCSGLPGNQPLFHTAINIHAGRDRSEDSESAGRSFVRARRHIEEIGSAWSEYAVVMNVVHSKNDLLLRLDYDDEQFEAEAMVRLLEHFKNLLLDMPRVRDREIHDLKMISNFEQRQILDQWNDTRVKYKGMDKCLHELIEAQVARKPNSIAASFEGQSLTYGELNAKANQLAHYLRGLGVGPDVLVGVCVNRSLEMIVGLLAVMKAGGAYVPIDPEYPIDRIQFMFDDIRAPVLLTQSSLMHLLPKNSTLVCLDRKHDAIERQAVTNPRAVTDGESLAYGIYTSGSTGKPKCALNTHQGIVNRLLWMQAEYKLKSADRILQKTPFSFDVSVWEFFWPLLAGARLVFARPGGHRDPAYLTRLIRDEKITTLHFVPSMLQVFLEDRDVQKCTTIKRVICSGEALPKDLQDRFFSRSKAELHNLYGPTEAAVDVSYWPCERKGTRKTVPIGWPIANIQLYILDAQWKPVPIGVAGELLIGGIGLARGYWNRPELTAQKFIANPLSSNPADRLYRTGDLARFNADGSIEYLGRLDHQVKIRGLRIELGEIEATLCADASVREAVVVARDSAQGEKQLVAYLVLEERAGFDSDTLRANLGKTLPTYMVPVRYVILDTMPLSPNGKVDRKALPEPEGENSTKDKSYSAPLGETTQLLASIWQDVLGVSPIGVNDNYFAFGGDSLRAIQIVLAARKAGLHLDPSDVLENPTVSELARRATENGGAGSTAPVPIERARVGARTRLNSNEEFADVYPATRMQAAQIADYGEDRKRNGVYHYQKTLAIEDAELSLKNFKKALDWLTNRHAVLRTVFIRDDKGELYQAVTKNKDHVRETKWYVLKDLTNLAFERQDEVIKAAVDADRVNGFNTNDTSEYPFRFTVFVRSTTRIDVLFTFHHAICDGWGKIEFFNDLLDLYSTYRAGGEPADSQGPNVFKEFVALESEILDSKEAADFWRKRLMKCSPMATPALRQVDESGEISQEHDIGGALTQRLESVAKANRVSVKAVFLSALFDLLKDESRLRAPIAGVVSNGRSERLSDPLKAFGLFWNIVPVSCEPSADKAQQISQVQRSLVQLEPFARYPLDQMLIDAKIERPFFATFNFIYFHNSKEFDGSEGGPKVEHGKVLDHWSFPLNFTVLMHPFESTATLRVAFDANRFDSHQVQKLVESYLELLNSYGLDSGIKSTNTYRAA